jgi:hypothetical protein
MAFSMIKKIMLKRALTKTRNRNDRNRNKKGSRNRNEMQKKKNFSLKPGTGKKLFFRNTKKKLKKKT